MEYKPLTHICKDIMPPSTARYYIEKYNIFFDYIGDGRKRRYSTETTPELLSFISDCYARKIEDIEIKALLAEKHNVVEIEENNGNTNEQQNNNKITTTTAACNVDFMPIFKEISENLKIIANQQQDIDELKTRLAQLEQQQQKKKKKLFHFGK